MIIVCLLSERQGERKNTEKSTVEVAYAIYKICRSYVEGCRLLFASDTITEGKFLKHLDDTELFEIKFLGII